MKQIINDCLHSAKENPFAIHYVIVDDPKYYEEIFLKHTDTLFNIELMTLSSFYQKILQIYHQDFRKKTDIQNDKIYISRSIRKHQTMNDDLSFSGVEYTIEERIKGNQTEGFRYIPLTAQAKKIVDKTIHLYPEGEYLFMRNGKPLFADSFNRYLKNKVCAPLNIPYRSSHQIRFTVATMLYEAGVPLNQLSTMLGHSDTRTTFHYIRQQTSKKETYDIMKNVLDVNR